MPIKQTITQQDVVTFLNRVLESDPEAMRELLKPVLVRDADLLQIDTIQFGLDKDKLPTITLLGLLNGLFGINEENKWGAFVSFSGTECPECGSLYIETESLGVGDNCPSQGCDGKLIFGGPFHFEAVDGQAVPLCNSAESRPA